MDAPNNNSGIDKNATTNPLAGHLNITVSLPDTITIKMVNATALEDYEIWFFISSLLFAAVVGFGVPFILSFETATGSDKLLGAITGVWLVLFIASFIVALKKRHALRAKGKEVNLKVTPL